MALTRKTCDGCGKEYWSPEADWQHKACVRSPVLFDEIRTGSGEIRLRTAAGDKGCALPGVKVRSKRWDKAAYNAYMREYMRAWRKKK